MFRLLAIVLLLVFSSLSSKADALEDLISYSTKITEYSNKYQLIQKEITMLNELINKEMNVLPKDLPAPVHILDSLEKLDDKVTALKHEGYELRNWLLGKFDPHKAPTQTVETAAYEIFMNIGTLNNNLSAKMAEFNGIILNWRFRHELVN